MDIYYQLTEKAIAANNLINLILGDAPYAYRNKWSPAPGPTDLCDIYDYGICEYAELHSEYDMKNALQSLVPQLCRTNAGIYAVASIILIETNNCRRGRRCLQLDLQQIASELRQSIKVRQEALRTDMSLGGAGWPNGLLDDLRRLSRNTESIGGPSFAD